MRKSLIIPDKTIVLHWTESQRAWVELPWADWVRFRGVGHKEPKSLAGAQAGEHYFLVCMLGRQGELHNVIPHRYIISTDARLVHGFDGLEPLERDETDRIEGLPFPTIEDLERLNELIGRGFSVNLPPLHTITHSLRTIPGIAGALPDADCWNFLSAVGVCRASKILN
jgi:hypothetical protein